MAMPLSEELWRPTSCNCRGRSGLRGGLEAPSMASPGPWAATSPGPSCDVLAEDEDCSGHAVSRLLALTSEWLASEEELDRLRSSPPLPGWPECESRLSRFSSCRASSASCATRSSEAEGPPGLGSGRTGRSPNGPLVGEMPRTMQSNRKLICSPSAEDKKKTPAQYPHLVPPSKMNPFGTAP